MRFILHLLILLSTVAQLATAATAAEKRPPNIIFILADDLGYGDLSCYGQRKFSTPNIDALARRGMRFTQHYSGSTVCAPSRCALMTGRHMGHAVVRNNAEHKPEGQKPMPPSTYTVAEHLQSAGYKTGLFGKWGLGYPGSTSEPLKMGFDRFYGYNCQRMAHSYYPAFLWNDAERQLLWGNVGSHSRDYAPQFIQQQALEFIRDHKDQPFFCYYAAIQPHADMIAPERYMEQYRGKFLPESEHLNGHYIDQPEGHAALAAMVTVLDDYVGQIVAELERLNLAENTLLCFSSDNGPHLEGGHDPRYFDSNGPLRGFKRDLYEGGIRVPMIATWPETIEAGTVSYHVSAFWDFLPTVADLVDKPLETQTDGISMLPTLLGQQGQQQHDHLYWEYPALKGRVAIRRGDWKGVRYKTSVNPSSPLELYDLANDPGESNNVASKHPDIVRELDSLIERAHREPQRAKNAAF